MSKLSQLSGGIKAEASDHRDALRDAHRRGDNIFDVTAAYSKAVDGLLVRVTRETSDLLDREFALVAVGGYGRRQLCPHSDIDLLLLRESPELDGRVQQLVRELWDGGFELGHSVRTVAECYKFMVDDEVTATALLESRFIAGDERLHDALVHRSIDRYRRRHGAQLARRKLDALRESTEAPGRTIYVLEPHLKDGKCGLRDLQRVLWVENARRGIRTFEEFENAGVFEPARVRELRDAYAFFLRVRCENHLTNGLKQDVLDADSILENARHLGYGQDPREAVERLLADYYRHARQVSRFIRLYLETETEGRRFLGRLAFRLLAKPIGRLLLLYKGRLFLQRSAAALNGRPVVAARSVTHEESSLEGAELAEEIAGVFRVAHDHDAHISEELREWIRGRVADADLEFERSSVVQHAFLYVLRGETATGKPGRVGRIVKSMHETGFLRRLFPEFGKIEGLVNLDGHHQFTVDEHILRTLEVLDSLEGPQEDRDAREFSELYSRLGDRLPLRLALFLHDIGKAVPGDHSVSGRATARIICERLGVSDEVTETVAFLVYHHLRLFEVSQRQDITDHSVIEAFARLVGSVRRLDMLYLLTYVDIRAVGPGTWTAWKGAQLAEVYRETRELLDGGSSTPTDLEEVLQNAKLGEEERALVLDHCRQVGSPSYLRTVPPERMRDHEALARKTLESGECQVVHEALFGYSEITVVCRDRSQLFADLTGVLHSEGLNVLTASIFSRDDGVAIDLFVVEIADGVRVSVAERADRVQRKLRQVEARRTTVSDMIHTWNRTQRYRPRVGVRFPKALFGPSVTFVDDATANLTAIDVSAGDQPGLLFALASTLGRLSLDVRGAKVSTVSSRARDVFFVLEADGAKVTNPARMAMIRQELLDSIADSSTGFLV